MTPAATGLDEVDRPAGLMRRLRERISRWFGMADTTWTGGFAPHSVVMGLLFGGALLIGALILPGEDERIAALERDGQTRRALQLLEARFEKGDRRQRTLFELQRFYEYYGDNEKSRAMLELLGAQRPRDALIQRQLAQLYKATQDEPAYIRTLKAQLALRYAEPACRELIGLLRRSSNFAEEQATIISCRNSGYRRPDDLVRLAFLQASDGDFRETALILRAVDDRRWLREGRERLMLYTALIETQQFPEALRRAVRWLRGQPDDDLALEMVYKLVDANRNDLAIQLAREVGQPGDPVLLAAGEIMVDQVQYAAARAFLSGWLEQSRPMDLEVASRFVAAALDCEAPLLALKGGEKFGLSRLEQVDLAALAEPLAAGGQWGEFDKVSQYLSAEHVAANALLAGAMELRRGRAEMARAYFARVRADELDDRRLGFLQNLQGRTGGAGTTVPVLRERASEPAVAAIPSGLPQITGQGAGAAAAKRAIRRSEINKRIKDRRQRLPTKADAKAEGKAQSPFSLFGNPSPPPFQLPQP